VGVLDNPPTILALSALAGSTIGALTSTVGPWLVQRHRERRELFTKTLAQREQLYAEFINESARLLVDAMQHSLENPGTLVPLYALLSRIRLTSSTPVIESGERMIATIIKIYFEPNLTPDEIQSAANRRSDHLQEFSETCRRELEALAKRF
jgi:hypothetical protein